MASSSSSFQGYNVYDAIVVGIGGHGSAALAHLAKALPGGKVLGIERFDLAHPNGSSHGKSRIYRQAYFEDPSYVPLLQRALTLWKELKVFYEAKQEQEEDDGQPLLNLCGGLMVGKADDEIVQGTLRSIAHHSLPHEILTPDEVAARYPMFRLAEDEIAVFETSAGTLNPEKCILAHVLMAKEHGAEVHCLEEMLSYEAQEEEEGGLVVVQTDKQRYLCKKLVLTVGAWAPQLLNSILPFPLHVERRVLFWFRPRDSTVNWRRLPVYIWDLGEGNNFYGFPEDGTFPGAVKIAQHGQVLHTLCADPDSLDREVAQEEVDAMRALFQQKIPGLDGELLETATCMYTMTPDDHFLIDLHPQHPNIVLASPCSGHGYKFCSVVGEILKDLALTGETEYDISLFRLGNRSSLYSST